MPRVSRPHYPHQYYHIFNIGFDRKKIFICENDYLRFLKKLKESRSKFDWIIYGYCLLPNHYHLHIKSRNNSISKIIHSVQTSHSVYFNRNHKHFSPVFSGRFKSIIIQKDKYHLQLSKYIHLNPVKAGLVNLPQDYPYSSYSEIIRKPKHEFKIMDMRTVKSLIGNVNKQSIVNYRKFVEEIDECDYSLNTHKRGVAGSIRFQSQFE